MLSSVFQRVQVYWNYGPNYHPTFQVYLSADTEKLGLRLLEKAGEGEGEEVWAASVPLTGTGHPQGPHSGFCFCSTLLKLMTGSNAHQPDASQSHSQRYLNRRKPHPL